jgi:N,N'-diacetylchitobiose transport system substrate-binding protein
MKRSMAVTAVAALALTACGNGDGSGAEGETLSVWIMEGTNPDAGEFFEDVKADFKKETGATLDVEFVQWADAHDKFVTSIAGNTTPDVAETGTTWTAEFADAGALAPLDEQVQDAGLKDDLVEGLAEAGTLDDTLYGMPWYAGVRSVVYRTDIFEELGLEPPTTWDELLETGLALESAKPELTPFAVPGDSANLAYPFIWGNGAELATQDGGKWTSGLDSPEAREGLQFYTDLALTHGLSSAGATTWNEKDVLDNFVKGNLPWRPWAPGPCRRSSSRTPTSKGRSARSPSPGPTAATALPSWAGRT